MEEFGRLCASFLLGMLTGAAGGYYANKYTDRRRESEACKRRRKQFRRVRDMMPELISEMKADVAKPETRLVREFFLCRREYVLQRREHYFVYYENDHEDLKAMIKVLENHGLVEDVTTGSTPKYRMTEEFVELLLESKRD